MPRRTPALTPPAFSRAGLLAAVALGAGWPVAAQKPTVVDFVGENHKLLLLSDGRVFGWGAHRAGELGPNPAIVPTRDYFSARVQITLPGKAIGIAAVNFTSYALLEDGTVWGWGRGWSGQLGPGVRESAKPVQIKGLGKTIQIVAMGNACLALQADGTVKGWGQRGGGALAGRMVLPTYGDNPPDAPSPVTVPGATGITRLAEGSGHILALTADGRVLSWGSNFGGALGRPPRQEIAIDTVGPVQGLTDVALIAGGLEVSTAVKKDGTVWVWGSNWNGQFGNGERTNPPNMTQNWVLVPQRVPGVANVTALASGQTGRHTLVLLADGTLRGWGNTDWGQLGGGLAATFQPRVMTPRISGVKAIFAAGNNSLAVKTDGTIWAWGAGNDGDLLPKHTKLPVMIELP